MDERQVYNPEVGGLSQEAAADNRPEGSHGTGYRFMPVSSMPNDLSPVLLPVAGMHPGLTVDQLAAPQPLPTPEQGQWIYHRLVGDALPTGFVALPGTEQLSLCPDSVAVVCTCASLGLELADRQVLPPPPPAPPQGTSRTTARTHQAPCARTKRCTHAPSAAHMHHARGLTAVPRLCAQEHDILAIIDRADESVFDSSQLDSKDFYALADEFGVVHIRWIETLPANWRVVGRLLYAQMPFVKKPGAAGGFAEFNDDFEF